MEARAPIVDATTTPAYARVGAIRRSFHESEIEDCIEAGDREAISFVGDISALSRRRRFDVTDPSLAKTPGLSRMRRASSAKAVSVARGTRFSIPQGARMALAARLAPMTALAAAWDVSPAVLQSPVARLRFLVSPAAQG
jgi:hypothetical protein